MAGKMHVLIVEDNPADARLVRAYLESTSGLAEVMTAATLRAAAEMARERPPDAILLDMSLPDGEGIDAVARMHAAAPNVPIVILSALQDEAVASQALQLGAQDYLIKGRVEESDLRRALHYAIERQQLLQRLARSEARLQDENAILRHLAAAAGRLFATLDERSLVKLLAQEARQLFGARVDLYARGAGLPDTFLEDAFNARRPVISDDRSRLAVPIAGTSGRTAWLLDVWERNDPFTEGEVFALDLLRRYVTIAAQNLALFGELQEQRSSILQLNHLKDDLIAVLAHDFKGPLTTIMGFAELLELGELEGDEAESALRTIRQSATRLANLANDTLELSRIDQGELNLSTDPVDLGNLMREVLQSVDPSKRVRLDVAVDDPVVRGDPARLRQVFENIVGNAMKYSAHDAPVEVRIDESERDVRVLVTDCGIGIPPDEIRFMFDRFSRGSNAKKSKVKGTGLGLYLARVLVERHGGKIEIESEVGRGSTFTVCLPRVLDGVGGVLRVFILTGDHQLAPYITHELRDRGFATRRDRTLAGLLQRIDIEPPEIVIVDLDTVSEDVAPLIDRACAATPPIALIAIGSAAAAQSSGWKATLPKPFLTSDLEAALARAQRTLQPALRR